MRKRRWFSALIFVIPAVLAVATIAVADSGQRNFSAGLIGYQEVPAISTTATGTFEAVLVDDNTLEYQLTYSPSELGTVTQSHIHLGQRTANGAIIVFLCSNLGNGPAGTQACPASGTISGTITSANVLAAQGIAVGEFNELVRALRAGVAYANVHSTTFGGGEFRGQINDRDQRGDDN